MENKKVLVSVLNYNSIEDAIETLESLSRMSGVTYDLELVDNASTNGCLKQIIPRIKHLPVSVVTHNENCGYAGGMNSILRRGFQSNYHSVLVCNSDIKVEPDSLVKMLTVAKLYPDAAVVGAVEKCYFTEKIRAIGGGAFSLWFGRGKWLNDSHGLFDRISGQYRCVQGAFVLFTKIAYEHNIYMDENLFMYYEEADLGFKIKSEGLSAYVAHSVIFQHKSEAKYLDLRSGYYQQRNRVYMVSKYGRIYQYMFFLLYISLFELPAKLIIRSFQGRFNYGWNCVLGFIDGVRGVTGRWLRH